MDPKKRINYYVEPVEIEIYLKKAGKVRTIIKDLNIELIDAKAHNAHSEKIFSHFMDLDEPIDLMEVMNNFPEYMTIIFDSYYQHIALFEKLSMHFKEGLTGSIDSWRLSIYFTELLMKYEPTIASSDYLGDFQTFNLNYLIRKLNSLNQRFLLEDSTVEYLIKRRNRAYEGQPRDREFDKLVELWHYNIKEKEY
jgi:hypothetical protein